jgi:hypothetical protein
MPKVDIDYSNTIFYKIHCKNSDVKDIYIGHTTNFVQRKYAHKRSCINTRSVNFNCKVYTIIREFGGWNNWKMEIIAFRDCADHYAARVIEQQYFEEYNATMNSIEPFPKPRVIVPKEPRIKTERKLFYCEMCNVYFSTQSTHDKHNQTNKHIKNIAMQKITHNSHINRKRFYCENCKYTCTKKNDFTKHLQSKKHNATDIQPPDSPLHICTCGKQYTHRASLFNHKKKCLVKQYTNTDSIHTNNFNSFVSVENEDHRDELIERLVSSNTEMVTSSNEMKSMFQLLLEKYHESQIQIQESQLQYHESQLQNQELINKVIDVIPPNSNN